MFFSSFKSIQNILMEALGSFERCQTWNVNAANICHFDDKFVKESNLQNHFCFAKHQAELSFWVANNEMVSEAIQDSNTEQVLSSFNMNVVLHNQYSICKTFTQIVLVKVML